MKKLTLIPVLALGLLLTTDVAAQSSNDDELKEAAIEALITAPPQRALPLVNKVLAGEHSNDIKEKALFILSQINLPEAQASLQRYATDGSGELQHEAIRMIGIGGHPDSLAQLRGIYDSGNHDTREAVLEALMIAGDKDAVFTIAQQADGRDFEEAVEMLAVMGATDELRQLRTTRGPSEALVEACAISDDLQCLREIAADKSNGEAQLEAIESMGIIGGNAVNATLVEIYQGAERNDIREAALDGMLISGYDEGVLMLYQSSDDNREKKELLERLVIMNSDEVWDLIDAALDGTE